MYYGHTIVVSLMRNELQIPLFLGGQFRWFDDTLILISNVKRPEVAI